jgi:hypothetical protein
MKQSLQAKDYVELKNGIRAGLAQALGGAGRQAIIFRAKD